LIDRDLLALDETLADHLNCDPHDCAQVHLVATMNPRELANLLGDAQNLAQMDDVVARCFADVADDLRYLPL
jgi:hypothetical protein